MLYANAYAEQKKNRYFGMYGFVKRTLVVTEPELIKIVLIKEFESFHDRGLYFNERVDPMSSNMFLLEGKKWRNLRKKCTPIFTLAKLKGMFGTVADIGERLSQVLKPKADKREVIEIKDLFARYVTKFHQIGLALSVGDFVCIFDCYLKVQYRCYYDRGLWRKLQQSREPEL